MDEKEFYSAHLTKLKKWLKDSRVEEDALDYFLMDSNAPYFLEDIERYQYTNVSGANRLLDLFYFNQHKEFFSKSEEVLNKTDESLYANFKKLEELHLKTCFPLLTPRTILN